METMTSMSVLRLFPETKEQQDTFVEMLVNQVLDGNVDPLEVEVQMCQMEQVIKKYRSDRRVQEACLNEAEKYNQKSFDYKNARINIRETGMKYDYTISHDWQEANARTEEAKEAQKAIQKRLQTVTKNAPYIDITSGEEITAIQKSSTTRVVIEINKK